MTPKEYLENILKGQQLNKKELEALSDHREEVESTLREKYSNEPSIKYGGSKAKDTMIRESYDLDIICYFPNETDNSLKDIYDGVQNCLASKYLVDPKTSALRIMHIDENKIRTDYHIDVVPGKYTDESKSDAFLYLAKGENQRIKTNLDVHIEHISKSGCRDAIKLAKLWKTRNNIPIKTFVLELMVIQSLKNSQHKDDLEMSLTKLFNVLHEDVIAVQLIDPANTNNVVSDLLSESDRVLIASGAQNSIDILNSENYDDVTKWRMIFKDNADDKTSLGPTIIIKKEPPKQWCYL